MEEITFKKGLLKFQKRLSKNETYKFSKSNKFCSLSVYKKPQALKGISSYCGDGKHVIFIDWDNTPKWLVQQDFSRLQKEYKLPPGYLFTTKEKKENGETFGSYHIICLAKFYPAEVYEIICKTHSDVNFMSMPLRNKYRNWILRISDKRRKERPRFLEITGKNINLNKEISLAHLIFLTKIYKLPKINYKNTDKIKSIFLQEYEAS